MLLKKLKRTILLFLLETMGFLQEGNKNNKIIS